MSAGEEGGETLEIHRSPKEMIHYDFEGMSIQGLVNRGLIEGVLKRSPGTEVKGILFGKRISDKWVALTTSIHVKGGKKVIVASLDHEDTKPLKDILRVVADVAK